MNEADPPTLNCYRSNAASFARQYNDATSAAARLFPIAFPAGARVLEVGCGSGRDLNALMASGYDATGLDACEEMLVQARQRFPALAGRITRDTLPGLSTVADQACDGVLCWSVLMHVPEDLLPDAFRNLHRILRAEGRLLISTPLKGPAVDPKSHRDDRDRLFNGVTPERFRDLLGQAGFRLLNRWDEEDSLGRQDRSWATSLFVSGDGHGVVIDRMERMDRKENNLVGVDRTHPKPTA